MLRPYRGAEDQLDDYSQQMAVKIFARYPELCELAQVRDDNTLLVTIPWERNPHGDIILATFNKELTIFIGRWHCHFNERPDHEPPEEGLELLGKIFRNEVGFFVESGSYGVSTSMGLMDGDVREKIEKMKEFYRSGVYKKSKINVNLTKYYWGRPEEEVGYHKRPHK